jgi:kynurenine formamidase
MTGDLTDEEIVALFKQCSNTGRWGGDDELGTLNHITDDKRRQAAALVRHGRTVSIGRDMSTVVDRLNTDPVRHRMLYDQQPTVSALDSIELATHGFALTHLDAITHVFWRGNAYNGQKATDLLSSGGLRSGSVYAQRAGIATRGVLLDVAGARGVAYLTPEDTVTAADLSAAEEFGGVPVETGDCVFVHVGLERRERVEGGVEDPTHRAGLHANCLPWLHQREVAVYSGDCVERIPYPSSAVPLPLHQIGLVAMGLVLLDCPRLEDLVATCAELATHEFMIIVAPLRLRGATGSPVNPLCLF